MITYLNISIVVLCFFSAVINIATAMIDKRPRRYVKMALAVSFFAAGSLVVWGEMVRETETGYGNALLLLMFMALYSSVTRYVYYKSDAERCDPECPYAS